MEIKFKQTDTNPNLELGITVTPEPEDGFVAFKIYAETDNGNESVSYYMEKEELSDFIGTLIHVQSKLKRGV